MINYIRLSFTAIIIASLTACTLSGSDKKKSSNTNNNTAVPDTIINADNTTQTLPASAKDISVSGRNNVVTVPADASATKLNISGDNNIVYIRNSATRASISITGNNTTVGIPSSQTATQLSIEGSNSRVQTPLQTTNIVATWKTIIQPSSCEETKLFDDYGNLISTSLNQKALGRYTFEDTAVTSIKKLTIHYFYDNGATDCKGKQNTKSGNVVWYLSFPSNSTVWFLQSLSSLAPEFVGSRQ